MLCIFQLNKCSLGKLNGCSRNTIFQNLTRNVYSDLSMGIDAYDKTRKRVEDQFLTFAEKFKNKMEEFVQDGPSNMIFTEDLKNMIHLCKRHELDLVSKMVTKFNAQNKEMRFGTYVFGPVVMRMYHYFDAPTEALQAFNNPDNNGFFDQIVSYHLLLNMLYKHEMYDDMFNIFEYITSKQVQMMKYPKHVVVLIMAACYKKNTKESLDYASKLWLEMTNAGVVPMRKAATFFAGLALNQGAPHITIEILSTVKKQHYHTVRNLKVVALTNSGRVEDALPVLRALLDADLPTMDKHTFLQETLDTVKHAISDLDNKELQREFDKIEKALQQRGLIDEKSLDSLICETVVQVPSNNQGNFGFQTNQLHTSFHRGRRVSQSQRIGPERSGLDNRY